VPPSAVAADLDGFSCADWQDLGFQRVGLPLLSALTRSEIDLESHRTWRASRRAVETLRLRISEQLTDCDSWCELKGRSMEALYPPGYARHANDLDLLVRNEHAAQVVRRFLASQGLALQKTGLLGQDAAGSTCQVEMWRGDESTNRVRAEMLVRGIPTSRASWWVPNDAFWSTLQVDADTGVRIASLPWRVRVFLMECLERTALHARDLLDFIVLRAALATWPAIPIAERLMRAALEREVSALDRVPLRGALGTFVSRYPQSASAVAIFADQGIRGIYWDAIRRIADSTTDARVLRTLAHLFPPDLGDRVLSQRRSAVFVRVRGTARSMCVREIDGHSVAVLPTSVAPEDFADLVDE